MFEGDDVWRSNVEENGFYDSVGGYHSEGIGFSPSGEWCGECCFESCEQCQNYAQK